MPGFKPLGLSDLMPFGKFKGTKIRVLLFDQLAYIKWVLENTELELDDQAYNTYLQMVDE